MLFCGSTDKQPILSFSLEDCLIISFDLSTFRERLVSCHHVDRSLTSFLWMSLLLSFISPITVVSLCKFHIAVMIFGNTVMCEQLRQHALALRTMVDEKLVSALTVPKL